MRYLLILMMSVFAVESYAKECSPLLNFNVTTLNDSAGSYPQWNFHKYLIDGNGQGVTSYQIATEPLDKKLVNQIKQQLIRF